MNKPKVCILKTDGTNCDQETAHAFSCAGAESSVVHVNELRGGHVFLRDFQILAIPGGFSYGDDIASGKVLANELCSFLADQLTEFVDQKKPVIGICNGFQVLVRTGLLPFRTLGKMQVTLAHNTSGHFECRWVNMTVEQSPCIFTRNLEELCLTFQSAHGEGQFRADPPLIAEIEKQGLVVLRYAARDGDSHRIAETYPANPNGSTNSIAGVCDPTGLIFGLMPHPERYVERTQFPNWRRASHSAPHGLPIFTNAVGYAREL